MPEHQHRIKSQHLGNERKLWIHEPESKPATLDLLIILDAELYINRVQAPKIIDHLSGQSQLPPLLVVFVSHVDMDTRWIECPCHPPFAAFIATELLPWIHKNYPATRDANQRALTGLSYTGLAASFTALSQPGLFTHVISQSGSYWSANCWLTKEYDLPASASSPAFFLDVGDKENQQQVWHKKDLIQTISQIEGVERFRDMLLRNGYHVRYETFAGGHTAEAWATSLPKALKWAFQS